jgi:8-oxo-dGTP pyrophosphatase MutT (NUDIX family)
MCAGWLFVDHLWVHGDLRKRGIGRELLRQAEQHAILSGCHSAWLDTFSFQAPQFYQRLGYEVFGALDYPPDHRRLFLKKRLLSPDRLTLPKRHHVAGNTEMRFPISVKGVLLDGDRVVLLQNERHEWELPGGRLEPGEEPVACLEREFAEELGADILAEAMLDCWLYEVVPQKEVFIATYGVRRLADRPLRISREHRAFGEFAVSELDGLPMPEGYRRSIRAWAVRRGA